MASSSSAPCRTWKYDVFPSFRGEDVRKKFRSHLVTKLQSRLITTFCDDDMERSRVIRPELLSAIRESRIAIVICSKNYASSTWCLDELVEIFKCFEVQMVIPVFYEIDPSHVRNQTGEFGDVFKETCKGKTEDEKQRWIKALTDVGNITGYDSQNGRWKSEAEMIEEISKEVSNRLFTTLDDFRDFVGIDDHVEAMNSKLCLESGEVRMVGIVGTSGIGKSTIARALFSRIKCQFHHQAFVSYRRNIQDKKKADIGIKLGWVNQFLSDIMGQNDIKTDSLGMVEQRLKHKKVLVVLDDVNEIELLETVVGKPEWFGVGSRIIVVTQDRGLLKSHGIDHIYEVELPSKDLALKMVCQSAFGQNYPPSGFMELAIEVAELVGNLPLGLNVLGSYLRGRQKEEWVEMKPRIQVGWDDKLENTLRISYDGLDSKPDQELFLYIACLFNGKGVNDIKNLFGEDADAGLKILAEKSLIRITPLPYKTVEMHILLQKLGVKIVREESNDPGRRRFLVDLEDIRNVLTDKTGTDNILGIRLNKSDIDEPLFLDGNSFKGMLNLQFIEIYGSRYWWNDKTVRLDSPQGLDYLPRKLRLIHWDVYLGKYLPSTFRAECLVELTMRNSRLEKLWEGTHNEVYPPLRSLKKMDLYNSMHLKEIPDLSDAINLETLNLSHCKSLVTPPALKRISKLFLDFTEKIDAEWIENIYGLTHLSWRYCPLRCMPSNFRTEHLVELYMSDSQLEKLWEGVQALENLERMGLSRCDHLKEIPDLSKAIKLKKLDMSFCGRLEVFPTEVNLESLEELDLGCSRWRSFPQISTSIKKLNLNRTAIEEVPSWIENMCKLKHLNMSICEKLEVLPTDVNLESLEELDFSQCSRLRSFPQISTSIKKLYLDRTAIEEVPSWIENMSNLELLSMAYCERLKDLPTDVNLVSLTYLRLSRCNQLRSFPQISTSIKKLYLDRTAIEEVPSWIENMSNLEVLSMECCERLKDLPTDVNLVSLTTLDLYDCYQLRTFPQISTSIEKLDLSGTAIEEVPSWIENISELNLLDMSWCKSLKNISPSIFKLRHLKEAEFSDCSELTSFSDASVVATEARITDSLDFPSDNPKKFDFSNCSSFDRSAQQFILGLSIPIIMVLPADEEVPTYFTHRSWGSSLNIPLPHSSPSHEVLRFKACVMIESLGYRNSSRLELKVGWRFRGLSGVQLFCSVWVMDHLLVFNFGLADFELNSHLSASAATDYNMEFEVSEGFGIKGCGVRVLDATPTSDDAATGISETESNQQSGEEYDAETGRSKKQMPMMVGAFEEPSNSLSFELGEASAQVSSSDFHGDGASLYHSVSSSYPCIEAEATSVDLMVTEQ